MNSSSLAERFYSEPAGTFANGELLQRAPDLSSAVDDPGNGYWHCNVGRHDRLTWSEKVYELFGLPAGAPIERVGRGALLRIVQGRPWSTCAALDSIKGWASSWTRRSRPTEQSSVGSGCRQSDCRGYPGDRIARAETSVLTRLLMSAFDPKLPPRQRRVPFWGTLRNKRLACC